MEESLYDEFGNYIGPELRSSDDESGSESESERSDARSDRGDDSDNDDDDDNAVRSYMCTLSMCAWLYRLTLLRRFASLVH